MDKKGGFNWLSPASIIGGVILLVVLFKVLVSVYPTLTTAGAELNASTTMPFRDLFGSNGVIWVVIGAAVLLGVIAYIGIKTGKR